MRSNIFWCLHLFHLFISPGIQIYFLSTCRLIRDKRKWERLENIFTCIWSSQTRHEYPHTKWTNTFLYVHDNMKILWKYENCDSYLFEGNPLNFCFFSLIQQPSNRSCWHSLFTFCNEKPLRRFFFPLNDQIVDFICRKKYGCCEGWQYCEKGNEGKKQRNGTWKHKVNICNGPTYEGALVFIFHEYICIRIVF